MKIMDYDHPNFEEFIVELSHEIKECNHDYTNTTAVLNRFKQIDPEIDIDKSIEFLNRKGGLCDCGVMFNAVTLANIVFSYATAVERIRNRILFLCPFHEEETPSFNVDEITETFKCYGCGAEGGVSEFLAMIKEK